MFFGLGVVSLIAIAAYAVSRKKFPVPGKNIHSRIRFATTVVVLFGILFGLIILALSFGTGGFIRFGFSVLGFSQALVAMLLAIITFFTPKFSLPLKQLSVSFTCVMVLVALVLSAAFYHYMNGQEVTNELVGMLAVQTGSANLAKYQKYQSESEVLYAEIARKQKDFTVCEKIASNPTQRWWCYRDTDPSAASRHNGPSVFYLKHTATPPATGCILEKYINLRIFSSDAIPCEQPLP